MDSFDNHQELPPRNILQQYTPHGYINSCQSLASGFFVDSKTIHPTAVMTVHIELGSAKGEMYITIDSTRFYTRLEGPTDAPVVVLIHALMANNHIYDSTVSVLHQAGYRTFRYDHVGHGQTLPPADPSKNNKNLQWTFDDFVSHMDTLYRTVVEDKELFWPAAIIGCSIGGVIAMRWYLTKGPPGEVPTKIISMAAPGYATLPGSPEKWQTRIEQWEEDGHNKNLAAQTLKRWFPNVPEDFDWTTARKIVESCTLDGYKICAHATMNFDYTWELPLQKGGENVMILAGSDDGNIGPREVLQDASRMLKGSKYVLLDGVGHIPPMHHDAFVPVMMDFLGPAT